MLTDESFWLIWPGRAAVSALIWLGLACLLAALARSALLGITAGLKAWADAALGGAEHWLQRRTTMLLRRRRRFQREAKREQLRHRLATQYGSIDWLSQKESARLRAASHSLERVVNHVEQSLLGRNTPENGACQPERSEVMAALLGWRRVVRLQGDIGRSLSRLERAREGVLTESRELRRLDKAITGAGVVDRVLVPKPLGQGMIQWGMFLLVLAGSHILLSPGLEAMGVPSTRLVFIFLAALLLAQVITAALFWQIAGRWLRGLSGGLMLAWSAVMGLLAVLGLPGAEPLANVLLRAMLGALVPLWMLAAVQWLPDPVNLLTRFIEVSVIGVLEVARMVLVLIRQLVTLLDVLWSGLVELLAAPIRTLSRAVESR